MSDRDEVVVFPTVEAVPDDLWRTLAADSLYVTPVWTQALARSRSDVPVVVVALRGAHGWEAGAAVYLYAGHEPSPTYDPVTRYNWGWNESQKAAARAAPRAVIGTRNGQIGGIMRRTNGDLHLQTSQLFAAVCEQFSSHVVALQFLEPQLVPQPVPPGALSVLADVGVHTPLGGSRDLDEVLRGFSVNARRQVRADLRTLDVDPPVTIDSLDELDEHLLLLGTMLANVESRHGNPADAHALAQYVRHCAAAADEFRVYLSGPPDAPAAFSLLIVIGREASVRVVGLDYHQLDLLGTYHYHRALMSIPLRDAVRHGARRMDSGVGALDAKLQRGGTPVELTSLVRFPDATELTPTAPPPSSTRVEMAARSRALAAKWRKGEVVAPAH
ncbi:hypothetical protein ABZ820_41020 [Streptomyces diacarni]|uniref:hypothetical protein n=1 Tax=Streptomyces diacarni TaxID=2800381 RepID=UPI003405EF96